MPWSVYVHPQAQIELQALPTLERNAILHAVQKLEELGAALPYPHSSAVMSADRLRELRPRAGRSAWRAFYRQVGAAFIIGAIGPEAEANSRGFKRSVRAAETRLNEVEEDQ